MSRTLSPEQAAKQAGLSRWTISRALQAGRIRGIRDNRGRWRIEPEALEEWLAEQARVQASSPHTELHTVQTPLHSEQHTGQHSQAETSAHQLLITEVAVLKTRLEVLESRAAELIQDRDEARSERDHWRQMAERLSEPSPSLPPLKPPASFLARLFGRT